MRTEREKKGGEKNWKKKYKKTKEKKRSKGGERGTRSICSKACNAEAVNGWFHAWFPRAGY